MIEIIEFNGSGFNIQVKIELHKSIVRSRMEYELAIYPETKSNKYSWNLHSTNVFIGCSRYSPSPLTRNC
jgi:hypothetical protein